MIRMLRILFFLVLCLPFIRVWADSHTFLVKGKVIDLGSGEPLIDATVIVENQQTHKVYQTNTGLDGSYLFRDLPEGSYRLNIQYIGYQPTDQPFDLRGDPGTRDLKPVLMAEQSQELKGVTISLEQNRQTDQYARTTEKNADNLLNIISARAIEISPDITVGNVLQRVPGVSVVRNNSGGGEYAIIRGMAKRYNYTTINGIKIPSPDDKSRSIPMDIFPADLLSRLEVIKSLTPDMEGDAIGGVTNLVLRNAPDHFVFNFNISGGYSGFFARQPFIGFSHSGVPFKSPRQLKGSHYDPVPSDFYVKLLEYSVTHFPVNRSLNFTLGNKINNRLRFLTAFTDQALYSGSSSLFYPPSGQPQPIPAPNTPVFSPIQVRTYYNLDNRMGFHGEINYDLSPGNHLKFYAAYFLLDQNQHRNIEEGLATYLHHSGEDITHDRSKFQRQTIYTNTLQGSDKITGRISADWSLVYSLAQRKVPDWVDQSYLHNVYYDSTGKLAGVQDLLNNLPFYWTDSREQDHSVYLNLHYALSPQLTLSAGVCTATGLNQISLIPIPFTAETRSSRPSARPYSQECG